MKALTIVVLVLLALLALFSALNWAAVTAPVALSLGFTSVQAPLGLVLLAGTAAIIASLLVFLFYQQAAALLEARRASREILAQRELADKAEASRFTDLRAYLEAELRKLDARIAETSNALAAHVAEVEDKVDRLGAGARPGALRE